MDDFEKLRTLAREKRDKAIDLARRDYEDTLADIAAVERRLSSSMTITQKSVAGSVMHAIPRDRAFTTADLLAGLTAEDPHRHWNLRAIQREICNVERKGIIRRIRRSSSIARAVYVLADAEFTVEPPDGRTLFEAIKSVLVEPMTPQEVAVRVLESGYKTRTSGNAFVTYVRRALRDGPFERVAGGKWVAE